ncbi:MAG: hypothetical protein IKD96_05060 [Oscillospiraceae bacterium]|nr:hypothetical protein [Oscillospiraceae bacterium]
MMTFNSVRQTSISAAGNKLTVLVEMTINGKQAIVPINIGGAGTANGYTIDSNLATTFHGNQDAINRLVEAIETDSDEHCAVYYINKNKAIAALRLAGNPIPRQLSHLDGLTHKITDPGSPVKMRFKDQTETGQFKRWFKGSVVVDENGEPLAVYHGTSERFTVFDPTKGRANMDIQGMFFSPWEIDAGGYGENVGAYYLSIKKPADEATAYKALNRFKGQNNAGVKAREYLISQGYDGVYNGYDEYIAFYPEQIKSATDNIGTFDTEDPDTRYSRPGVREALDELIDEYGAIPPGQNPARDVQTA